MSELSLSRRTFLAGVAGGATVSTLGLAASARAAESQARLPIVDCHQHLWDLDKFRLPWLTPGTPLATNHVMSDYLAATEGLNVVKTVYMEVDVDPKQQDEEIEYVSELCRRKDNPMAAAVVSGRPAADGFAAYLKRHKDNPYLRGIRQVLHSDATPKGYANDEKFVRGIQQLGEAGWTFDLCMRSEDLPDATNLVKKCPGTRFILDHCGNESITKTDHSRWEREIGELAKFDRVIGKISGVIASAKPGEWSVEKLAPVVNHTWKVFGPDRVVFGGDWPVCTTAASYKEWVTAIKQIIADRPISDQRKLLHDNAVKHYRLA